MISRGHPHRPNQTNFEERYAEALAYATEALGELRSEGAPINEDTICSRMLAVAGQNMPSHAFAHQAAKALLRVEKTP